MATLHLKKDERAFLCWLYARGPTDGLKIGSAVALSEWGLVEIRRNTEESKEWGSYEDRDDAPHGVSFGLTEKGCTMAEEILAAEADEKA